jgi:hypothetical protein
MGALCHITMRLISVLAINVTTLESNRWYIWNTRSEWARIVLVLSRRIGGVLVYVLKVSGTKTIDSPTTLVIIYMAN